MNWKQYRALMESEEITDRTQFVVLNALAFFADRDSAQSWPGIAQIAAKARLAVSPDGKSRATEGALKSLLEAGHISVVTAGGGRRKTTTFLLHIGGRGKSNPAADAGGETGATPQRSPETPQGEIAPAAKPRILVPPHKVEGAKERHEVVIEGDVGMAPSPAPPASLPPPLEGEADFIALQEVTGWRWGTRSAEHNRQLVQSMLHLRSLIPVATPENIRRFGQLWRASGKTKPYPGQVVSHWEDVFLPPRRDDSREEEPDERLRESSARSAFLTPRQHAAQKRRQQRGELFESLRRN